MINDIWKAGIFWSNKNNSRNFWSKIKISFISINLGIVVGLIVIAALGYNSFETFGKMITYAFSNKININTLLIITSIYGLSGLANAFAFKTGLFNIGVSGQMIAGGATSMLLALTVFNSIPSFVAIPLLIIISILVSAFVGLLVGFLKSQFNVNEVVSTILLNWIIFYLFKYIYDPSQSFVDSAGNSNFINYNLYFGGNSNTTYIASFVLMLVISISIFLLLKFTTFGRSLKMTGLNKDSSKYFGINTKFAIISSLVISAAIAGILGFIYYFARQHFVEKFVTTLPSYGFDGIAIALLAFNSPLAIPFISFIYAIFHVGSAGTSLPSSIQHETIMLIFSIVIYFSAVSSLMIRFKPFRFIRIMILIKFNKDSLEMKKESEKLISDLIKQENAKMDQIKKQLISFKNKDNSNKYKLLMNEYKQIEESLKIRISSIRKATLVKTIEIIDNNTQKRIQENYYLSKYYFLLESRQKYIFSKNQFILKNNKFSKQKIKSNINFIRLAYKKWLAKNKIKQKDLKNQYKQKNISKLEYIEKINTLINSKITVKGDK